MKGRNNSPIKWLIVFIWIIISIIEYNYFDNPQIDISNLLIPSIVILTNLVFQIICWKTLGHRLISFYFSFIVIYYLFHFGQIFITGLFPTYQLDYLNYVTTYMNNQFLGKTINLCITVINCFYLGGLLVSSNNKKNSYLSNYTYRDVAKKLFFFLLPLRIVVDLVLMMVAMYLGYYGVLAVNEKIPGIIAVLAGMWYAIIPLYYLSLKNSNNNKKCNMYCILVLLYLCATMLTGGRGHQVVAIISLMIVVLLTSKRINLKMLSKYAMYSLIGVVFIDIIYSMRETSISQFLNDFGSFTESTSKSNIIVETIGTFGETIYTPYLVIEQFGHEIKPFFGEAFLKSIVSIWPDIFHSFKTINNEAIYTKVLDTESAIGGSFAGEMYYNFGSLYPLPSIFFGALFQKLSSKIVSSLTTKHYIQAYLPVVIFALSLWWIRDCIGNLTRQIVWMIALMYLFGGFKKK